MAGLGARMTRGISLPIIGVGAAAAKTAIDFESAFAGVTKTVDATDEQLRTIRGGIRDMAREMPATTAEIAAVAEAAGALGVKAEDILGFTRTMIDLGETTDLTSDEASNAIARLTNIMGTSRKDVDRLGSAIVALGNDGASTESEITEMALRIAGAGEQIGLSETEVLGLASALSSVGIKAEAGGSAISKVMIEMSKDVDEGGDKLATLAEVADVSTDKFAEMFKKDAASALTAFIEGLGKVKESGGPVLQLLDDLGFGEIRTRDALLRLVGANDLLKDSLDTSSKAYKDNTALSEEAEKRYKTTASGLEILRNNVADLAIMMSKQLLPAVKAMVEKISDAAKWFRNLDGSTRKTILVVGGLVAALGPVIYVAGNVITAFKGIRTALKFLSAHPLVLVAAAVVALGVVVYKNWDTIVRVTRTAFNAVKETITGVWSSIREKTGDALGWIVGKLASFVDFWFNMAGKILTGADFAFGWMPGIGEKIRDLRDRFNTAADAIVQDLRESAAGFQGWEGDVKGAFNGAIASVNALENALSGIPTNITTTHTLVTSGTVAPGTVRAGRAHGGTVEPRGTYLVGERGPELLTMGGRAGNITPNYRLGEGGDTYNYNIYTDGTQDGRKVAEVVRRELENDRRRDARHDRTRGR